MSTTQSTYVHTPRQRLTNLVATGTQFVVSLAITFFLTQFIVSHIGVDAFGYIGLSINIISYTAVLTVAVNSMSQRFVSISYHSGDIETANRYYTSTFAANNALGVFLLIVFGVAAVFIERFIDIPPDLVGDVRALFVLLFINTAINLMTSTYAYSPFITNRLHLSSLLLLGTSVLRGLLLVLMFGLLPPRLWYVGAVSVVCSAMTAVVYSYWTRRLTPQLQLRRKYYSASHLLRMIKSAAWNVLSQISDILNQGFELLLANIFVGPVAMGVLAVTKSVSTALLSFNYALSCTFSPVLTHDYARGDREALLRTIRRSIYLLSAVSIIPMACVFGFSDILYHCWLPQQDTCVLYILTCVSTVSMAIAAPFEVLWHVFTITNKVRVASLNLFGFALATFVTVLIAVGILDDTFEQLLAIAGARAFYSSIRYLTFLPLYSARVLGLPRYTFYRYIPLHIVAVAVTVAVSLTFKLTCIHTYTWSTLLLCVAVTAVAGAPFVIALLLKRPKVQTNTSCT